jgi:DNA modification methylase
MWHFGRAFSWTVIERSLAEAGVPAIPSKKKFVDLRPRKFLPETTTLWSFQNRGNWAVHDSAYRGNWAPEVPRNLILRYTKKGDWVLDPFIGGGTTAIECLLLERNCIGFDVNPAALALARHKLKTLRHKLKARLDGHLGKKLPEAHLFAGDARSMQQVQSSSVQLVCAHPPYLDIIEYTRRNPADFSTIYDPDRYLREMTKVFYEVFRCLKPGGLFCILIGDVRRCGRFIPLGFRVLNALLDCFDLEEIVIKRQHQCATMPFYNSKKNAFLRIAHEYLFVLRKPTETAPIS